MKVGSFMVISEKLTKLFVVFFLYFLYTMYAGSIFRAIGCTDTIFAGFIGDIIFAVIIIYIYRKNLKSDFKRLKKESLKKTLWTIFKWVIIIFMFVIFCGFITDLIIPEHVNDANTSAVYDLYSVSTWYTIFKTMIFGTLVEEILYRESVRDCIKNNFMFIIVSSVIYTFLNTVFVGFTEGFVLSSMLIYFLPAIFWSIAYLRNNDNILLLSLIKFTYNLIPLTILLLGL